MATSKSPKKIVSTVYPEPLVVLPTLTHKQTIIILHGRGSNAETFGPPLLNTKLPDGRTFQAALPHAKFVFPTASKRRAQIYNRSIIHQWFDNGPLTTPNERESLMTDGLRESSKFIYTLLTEAIQEVGAENVTLGSLSQGCAVTLISILLWTGERLGAVFGMCGWLPLRHHMADIADPPTPSDGDENPFAPEEHTDEEVDLPAEAIAWLREELEFPTARSSSPLPFQQIPIFLAHGARDEKVDIELGRQARDCLGALGAKVEWREYEFLGHWYSEQMLGDLVEFLTGKTEESKTGLDMKRDTQDQNENMES